MKKKKNSMVDQSKETTSNPTTSLNGDVMSLPSPALPGQRLGDGYPPDEESSSSYSGGEGDVSALHDFIAGGVAGSASVVVGQ